MKLKVILLSFVVISVSAAFLYVHMHRTEIPAMKRTVEQLQGIKRADEIESILIYCRSGGYEPLTLTSEQNTEEIRVLFREFKSLWVAGGVDERDRYHDVMVVCLKDGREKIRINSGGFGFDPPYVSPALRSDTFGPTVMRTLMEKLGVPKSWPYDNRSSGRSK